MQEMVSGNGETPELKFAVNQAVKKVTFDIDNAKFNTAVSAIMILVNEIYKVGKLSHSDYKNLLLIISPFAPHLSNEIYEAMGYGENYLRLPLTPMEEAHEKELLNIMKNHGII